MALVLDSGVCYSVQLYSYDYEYCTIDKRVGVGYNIFEMEIKAHNQCVKL